MTVKERKNFIFKSHRQRIGFAKKKRLLFNETEKNTCNYLQLN